MVKVLDWIWKKISPQIQLTGIPSDPAKPLPTASIQYFRTAHEGQQLTLFD